VLDSGVSDYSLRGIARHAARRSPPRRKPRPEGTSRRVGRRGRAASLADREAAKAGLRPGQEREAGSGAVAVPTEGTGDVGGEGRAAGAGGELRAASSRAGEALRARGTVREAAGQGGRRHRACGSEGGARGLRTDRRGTDLRGGDHPAAALQARDRAPQIQGEGGPKLRSSRPPRRARCREAMPRPGCSPG
jgi:hypothetical protein